VVTSLFADLSGPATQPAKPDIVGRVAAIAERHGGFVATPVDRVDRDAALLVFFGAPDAHDDDPARALRAALEMQREVQLRIGVNTGRVITGLVDSRIRADFSMLGDAVILAQRLQSLAGPRETVVGEATFEATSDLFRFEPMGKLSLKGRARPTPGYRLVGSRNAASPHVPLVGRDPELAEVERLVAGLVRERRGGVMSIVGEAGIGKSRLLRAVHERATSHGVHWYEARCVSYGTAWPYWSAIELARQFLGTEHPDFGLNDRQIDAALSNVPGARPFIARLLGLPAGEAVADIGPDGFRRGLHRAVADWLADLATDGPVIVAVEDVQWADWASLALLGEAAKVTAAHPVGVVVTSQVEGRFRVGRLVESSGAANLCRIHLTGLDRPSTAQLVAALLGREGAPEWVDGIAERSRGNPLFIEQATRCPRAETLEAILSARIDLLPVSTARVLATTSVIGGVIRPSAITAVTDDVAEVDSEIDRLISDGLLDPSSNGGEAAVMLHHDAVEDAVYRRLRPAERRALHRRILACPEQVYRRGGETIDLLARHADLGETGPAAIEYLTAAAERARRVFVTDAAIGHYRRAIEIAEAHPATGRRVPALLLEVATLENSRGRFEEAVTLYEEVLAKGNDVAAWQGLAWTLRTKGESRRALEVLDRAFAANRGDDAAVATLWLEKGWALNNLGRHEEGQAALKAGLAVAGGPSLESPVVGCLLFELAAAEAATFRYEAALDHGLTAADVLERVGDLRGLTTALTVLVDTYRELGRPDEAAAMARRASALAERAGLIEERTGSLLKLGLVELEPGQVEEPAC
jgi:class 3 adenylate cyclase/tetratricopeptide (TPR) repeat protein